MSLSLMVFLVLFAQVWFDYRFNRNFDDYENIYRLEEPISYDASDYTYKQATLRPLIEAFESCSPDVLVDCDYEDYDLGLGQKVIFNDNGDIKKYDLLHQKAGTGNSYADPDRYGSDQEFLLPVNDNLSRTLTMNVKIQSKGIAGGHNSGSCGGYASYLEHENIDLYNY